MGRIPRREVRLRGPSSRLDILVLDEEPPYPLNSGKKIRTWCLLQSLALRHNITYVCYEKNASPAAKVFADAGIRLVPVSPRLSEGGARLHARRLVNLFSRRPYIVARHDRPSFDRRVREILETESFDLIQCEWTPYADLALRNRGQRDGRLPVLIATHNIETDILLRRALHETSLPRRKYFQAQAQRMERFERSVFASADFVVTVSERDEKRAVAWGARRTAVVSNGADTRRIQPTVAQRPKGTELLFVGALDWFANIDAIAWFVTKIFPLLRSADPSIHLRVVGSRPHDRVRRLVDGVAGVTLIGEVEDVRPFFARSDVVVVPLRVAGGTRIKILEAMAAGKPLVSTSIGAEGLEVQHGVHLLLADQPVDFARNVLAFLRTDAFDDLPVRARSLVEERYRWDLQSRELERCWLAATAQETADNIAPLARILPA